MNKTAAWLCALLAVSWMAMFMLWLDNRFLAGMAAARADSEWVRPQTLSKVADVCQVLAHVNNRDQALLFQAKRQLEEIDVIRRINQDRLAPAPGQRGGRHDEVRRFAERADEGSAGGGGVGGRSSADPP